MSSVTASPSTSPPSGRHQHKVVASIEEALADVKDGARIMVGGFGLSGNAEALIAGVVKKGVKDLTLISNNAGNLGKGLNAWLEAGIVRRFIGSYIGTNEALHRAMAAGTVEVEMTPQGTFIERIRAAGAGIPAFFTPTGAGTVVAEGKETRLFDGREHVLETALHADFALVRAKKADRFGNLRFYRTARNFSPVMCTAATTAIVECDELLDNGAIDPDDVHLPGLFVHRIVEVREHEDAFEYGNTRKRPL
ncbi:MAG: CoA transferase subunit A [Sandaracinaceae bacterium]|nr:CoA transferase subunit A [Sandaracinaceae bacterium]